MVFPKNFAVANSVKSNDDCYFYFYSSCTKGEDCPYRHCKLALGTETVCTLWEAGRCFRTNCKFRHMKSRVDRSQISCYWENQPGGCRKPHCVFLHRKLNRTLSSAENQSLILPVASGKVSPARTSSPEVTVNAPIFNTSTRSENSLDEADEGIHSPVEPFVVSFDENEESDSESVSSTPVKSSNSKLTNSINGKSNLAKHSDKPVEKSLDFGIKSLEQIRLEKIHKESANFYKTDDLPGNGIENFFDVTQNSTLPSESVFNYPEYQVPSLEDYKLQRCLEVEPKYPLTSEFIPLQPVNSVDVEQIAQNKEIVQVPLKQENDLRSLLSNPKKKNLVTNFHKDEPAKKVVNFKRNNNSGDDPLDFKIKTLDEIRKEKELKKNVNAVENGSCMTGAQGLAVNQNHSTNKVPLSTARKLKINRRSEGSNTVSAKKVKRRSESLDEGTDAKMLKLELPTPDIQQNALSNEIQPENSLEKIAVENLESASQNKDDSICEMSSPNPGESTMEFIEQPDETNDQVVENSNSNDESCNQTLSPDSSCNPVESSLLIAEADSSSKISADCGNESMKKTPPETVDVNSRTSSVAPAVSSCENVNRLLSIDELDHFFKDTDVNMDDLDENVDAGEDDIMLKINEILDS